MKDLNPAWKAEVEIRQSVHIEKNDFEKKKSQQTIFISFHLSQSLRVWAFLANLKTSQLFEM